MINFLYQFFGFRSDPVNLLGQEVEVCEWSHPVYNPSGHLGLKFEKDGTNYYFSFSPQIADGLSDIPIGALRQGRPGHMILDFREETLLWGFRHSWGENIVLKLENAQIQKLYDFYIAHKLPGETVKPLTPADIIEIRKALAAEVKREKHPGSVFTSLSYRLDAKSEHELHDFLCGKMANKNFDSYGSDSSNARTFRNQLAVEMRDHFAHLSDAQLYAMADMFTDEALKEQMRGFGQPQTTSLRTCDLNGMIQKINEYQNSKPKWAPLAGSYFHQPNTHNCSSIILDILYAGGMDRLTTSSATKASYVGALVGLLSLIKTDDPLWILASIGVGFMGGRAVGGAYDGCTNVQYFFNMNAGTKHDNTSTILGMRLLSTLMGAVIGMIKWGPFFPAYLTLPKNVVALVKEARDVEEATYLPNQIRQHGTGPATL